MAFAIAPDSLPDLCPSSSGPRIQKDVGTAPENRVAFAPFYWKSARVEACSGAFDLHFELVGSAGEFERLAQTS